MAKYRVFAERKETECATIEADSAEEAEELADSDYSKYDWSLCDGSRTVEILLDNAEEITDNE